MTMQQDHHANRLVLEVYFETKKGQRITQWFEFKVAENKITVRPIDQTANSEHDPHLQLSYNECTGFPGNEEQKSRVPQQTRRLLEEPMSSSVHLPGTSKPFALSREVSMAAPGCTRSQCIRCIDSRVKKPGGSRAPSNVNLARQKIEDSKSAGTSSSHFTSDGTKEDTSTAREDMVNEWLSNQLCLTRMKLKVILAFKKLVETKNNDQEPTSTSKEGTNNGEYKRP
ncbi:hypothetical protein GE061_010300 [Apolygus lucorum]|uniref:Uncharacterized protein n=1 Tax=Apolygus lucorum TaxID=248454 RepID=A0A6A4K3Y1_APOLU|nr:hypothetical protein GE061_010300 [Apolygus lucorum]